MDIVLSIGIPTIIGLLGWLMKNAYERLVELEHRIDDAVSKTEMRQVLQDQIEPIKEDVQELKVKLDKIIDILLKPRK